MLPGFPPAGSPSVPDRIAPVSRQFYHFPRCERGGCILRSHPTVRTAPCTDKARVLPWAILPRRFPISPVSRQFYHFPRCERGGCILRSHPTVRTAPCTDKARVLPWAILPRRFP